jgi:hypothetical protein
MDRLRRHWGVRALVAAVVVAGAAAATPPAATGPSEASKREYCSILTQCGLSAPVPFCSAALSGGVPDVVYDGARCAEPRRLFARGVRPEGDLGFRLYRFLGRRYRIVYPIEGRLELSPARMERLLADLPLAGRLLSHLLSVPYEAAYLDPDHVRFRGKRGEGLSGEAEIVAGGPRERSLAYFGHGRSQVGPWTMRGLGLVFVDYGPAAGGRGLRYHLQVVATPTNAFYNFLMNRGLFKSVLIGKVQEILDDIAKASRQLDQQGATLITDPRWSPEDRETIAALLRVP